LSRDCPQQGKEVLEAEAMPQFQKNRTIQLVDRRNFLKISAGLTAGIATEGLSIQPALAPGPPPKWDLRNDTDTGKNYISTPQDQLMCHSCTAFGVVATIEGTYNKVNNIDISAANALALSEAQLFFCGGPALRCGTSHWWPEDALIYCAQFGLAARSDYPYPNSTDIRDEWKTWCHVPPGNPPILMKIKNDTTFNTVDDIKNWIASTGPVVAVMLEYQDFKPFGDNYKGAAPNTGIYVPQPTATINGNQQTNGIVGGHVLSIIGYDASDPKPENQYWICKNSWGTNWNSDGFVRIQIGGGNKNVKGNNYNCLIDSLDVRGVTLS
jgi:hypothetical protein